MTDGQWARAKELFNEALELPRADRAAFVVASCGEDGALRGQVLELLRAHDEADGFLEPEGPGTLIGRYKLLQSIGEGGFGEVYMAEQEEPVRRRVALKIIKLGMDTKEVIARFEAERQALAMMEHPNIAKVLDAGATESGRPYFVMELVRGVPITEYCDTNRLDTRERLGLFVDVCRAVHHAHEKGIVHRDIKPSNVLVTLHDGTPVPMVIDFGIAKATNQRLTERTLFTAFGQFIGTPTYMSPEQAGLSNEEVDRRSDVYSLGVLLYELLTGTTPLGGEALRSAAFVEMLRLIREVDAPTPSARVQTLGDRVNEIASRRRADPGTLAKLIRGDLDWIALHAMEKDRRRRYASAAEFASDIERYFRHEPVVARQPSIGYRAGKYVKRHRTAVLASAAIVIAALLGALGARGAFARSGGDPAAAPSRHLVWDSAGRFDAGRVTVDGKRWLRYDQAQRGFQLIDLDTRKARLITHDGPDSTQGYPRDPLLSPDGHSIAAMMLSSSAGGWKRAELRLFPASGSGDGKRLAEWNGPIPYAQAFAFSPKQDLIWVWVMRDETADIASVRVADGDVRVLKHFVNRAHTQPPSLSPDGRFIVYNDADTPSAAPDVFILPVDGRPPVRLEHPARDWLPVFTPDGSGVVFISNRDGQSDVWYQALTDGRPNGEARKVWSKAAPYGQTQGFGQNGSLFYYFAANGLEIYTAKVDLDHHVVGAAEHIVARAPDQNAAPAFSPDGQTLAHLRGGHRLVLRRVSTGEEREYPIPSGVFAQWIDYCPDGRTVLLGAIREIRPVALRVNLERGGVDEVDLRTGLVPGSSRPVCVGPAIVFVRARTKDSTEIVRRPFDSTAKETILYRGLAQGDIYRSPIGDRIAFRTQSDSERVMVVGATGGQPRMLTSAPLLRYGPSRFSDIQGMMWLPRGDALLLARSPIIAQQSVPEESPEVRLWRVPVDGSAPSEAARMRLPAYKGGIWGAMEYAMDPAGTRIAFLRSTGFVAQEWAIANLMQFIQSGKTVSEPVQP